MIQTASNMELFQLVAACVGLALGIWGLATAISDTQLTRSADVDPRRIVALAHVRRQVTRIAVHAMLVCAGAVSVALPPPPPLHDSEQSVILHVILVIVTAILALDHMLDRRVRWVFINHPAFHQRHDRVGDQK